MEINYNLKNISPVISPGLTVIHSNQPEELRNLLIKWLKHYPLAPLEKELILVRNNGIGHWLKLSLAADMEENGGGCGIAAAIELLLPARFLWRVYRAFSGRESVPEISPFDKDRLIWRLMRLIPELIIQPDFLPLRRFLVNDADGTKCFKLSERIADLFDQYQVYRADWLMAWAQNQDVIIQSSGKSIPLPEDQHWQAAIWRRIISDIALTNQQNSIFHIGRAQVHIQFMQHIANYPNANPPRGIPRRLIIFGISTLPAQSLEALISLARWTQILFFVHNPCEYYWGDIFFKQDLSTIRREILLEHGHNLLTAWGKQGRDFITLLDESVTTANQIDLFTTCGDATLLQQLQDDIRALRPISETNQWPACNPQKDRSIRFHIAHSLVRELEILHDQLLDAFNSDPNLHPRDILVMVPDINRYATYVQAIFGAIDSHDPRFISFSLVDHKQRTFNHLINALEKLINLPYSYISLSNILELLDVPALRYRFGIKDTELDLLRHWIISANIRWGLHSAHRESLKLPVDLQNTWLFGMRRMLLGYAVGANSAIWNEIEPYGEIGGLDAAIIGKFIPFLDKLENLWAELREPETVSGWCKRLRTLMSDFFQVENNEKDAYTLSKLEDALEEWQEKCIDAQLNEKLSCSIVSEYLFSQLDQQRLNQRFFTGTVTFATLMPMRAIPFRQIYLLGMNDGDYPRAPLSDDLDLMANNYRAGDRSRNEEDRYLFLEALLSARERLYISWIGFGITDHTPHPPSVLVSQLRAHLKEGWKLAHPIENNDDLLAALTINHHPQPFNPIYFNNEDPRFFSYAKEWCISISEMPDIASHVSEKILAPLIHPESLTVAELIKFLKSPVKIFFQKRLNVYLEDSTLPNDHEPFTLDNLQQWKLQNELLMQIQNSDGMQKEDIWKCIKLQLQRIKRRGELPWGGIGKEIIMELTETNQEIFNRYYPELNKWPIVLTNAEPINFSRNITGQSLTISDRLKNIRGNPHGARAQIFLDANNLIKDKKIRMDKIIKHLLWHLVGNLIMPLTTIIIGRDKNVLLQPLINLSAEEYLHNLLAKWQTGMRQPLPLALKTAYEWLQNGEEKAQVIYEEQEYSEVETDPYLRRAYPNFIAISASGEFYNLAVSLFQPLIDITRQAQIYGE